MPRRVQKDDPAEVNFARLLGRCRQLRTRLRMVGAGEEAKRWLSEAWEIPDLRVRLLALLDLAEDLRPRLPAAVAEHALPDYFESWRAEVS